MDGGLKIKLDIEEGESQVKTRITTRKINNLAKKALLDGPKHIPAKGMMFLEDKKLGSVFETDTIKGVLLDVNDSSSQVVIMSNTYEESNVIGKIRIAGKTEVYK